MAERVLSSHGMRNRHHLRWITKGGQPDEGHTIGKSSLHLTCYLKTQMGFAHTWRPTQGEQAHICLEEQGHKGLLLLLAPDQRGWGKW